MSEKDLTSFLQNIDIPEVIETPQQTGRGPNDKLRNFKAMGDAKFYPVAERIIAENNDPEAVAAVKAEIARRGNA